jgi:hypothetical protein
MIEVQIRPCPFCGQEEELVVTGEEDACNWADCDDCGANSSRRLIQRAAFGQVEPA